MLIEKTSHYLVWISHFVYINVGVKTWYFIKLITVCVFILKISKVGSNILFGVIII